MQDLFEQVWEKKVSFLGTFFLVFLVSYIVLMAIDFLPEEPTSRVNNEETEETVLEEAGESAMSGEPSNTASETVVEADNKGESVAVGLPVSLSIATLGRKTVVLNPTSRAIADLDKALLEGVVRHPDSALLGQEGNVFILGHSSYLPSVFNKNFQAFNGIQNLKWGDIIEVSSDSSVYEYRVEKMYRAKAEDVTVPVAGSEKKLTLATCNSFGSVDDRFIVEAKQISERAL